MRPGLLAALVLGSVSFGVFALPSLTFFTPGAHVLHEIPLVLWLGCVAATWFALVGTYLTRVDRPTVWRFVGRGALAGAFLALVAVPIAAYPETSAVPFLIVLAAPVGAVFGAVCAFLGAGLLAAWLRLRPRDPEADAAAE